MVLRLICRNTNQAIKQVCDVGTVQARSQDLCVCVWGGGVRTQESGPNI